VPKLANRPLQPTSAAGTIELFRNEPEAPLAAERQDVRRTLRMTRIQTDVGLRTAKITAAFAALAGALYSIADTEPSPGVLLFFSFGPLIAVITWLQKDARRAGIGGIQDWGYFLLLAWPVLIPWYAAKTRGRAGVPFGLGLFALILAAYIGGIVGTGLRIASQSLN
jgi:hypothetical protein